MATLLCQVRMSSQLRGALSRAVPPATPAAIDRGSSTINRAPGIACAYSSPIASGCPGSASSRDAITSVGAWIAASSLNPLRTDVSAAPPPAHRRPPPDGHGRTDADGPQFLELSPAMRRARSRSHTPRGIRSPHPRAVPGRGHPGSSANAPGAVRVRRWVERGRDQPQRRHALWVMQGKPHDRVRAHREHRRAQRGQRRACREPRAGRAPTALIPVCAVVRRRGRMTMTTSVVGDHAQTRTSSTREPITT